MPSRSYGSLSNSHPPRASKQLLPRGTADKLRGSRNPHQSTAGDPFKGFVIASTNELIQRSQERALSPDVREGLLRGTLDIRPVDAERISLLEQQAERESPNSVVANSYCLEMLVKVLPWLYGRGSKNAFNDVIDWPAVARKLNEAQYTTVFGPERSAEYFRRVHVETYGGLRAFVAKRLGFEEMTPPPAAAGPPPPSELYLAEHGFDEFPEELHQPDPTDPAYSAQQQHSHPPQFYSEQPETQPGAPVGYIHGCPCDTCRAQQPTAWQPMPGGDLVRLGVRGPLRPNPDNAITISGEEPEDDGHEQQVAFPVVRGDSTPASLVASEESLLSDHDGDARPGLHEVRRRLATVQTAISELMDGGLKDGLSGTEARKMIKRKLGEANKLVRSIVVSSVEEEEADVQPSDPPPNSYASVLQRPPPATATPQASTAQSATPSWPKAKKSNGQDGGEPRKVQRVVASNNAAPSTTKQKPRAEEAPPARKLKSAPTRAPAPSKPTVASRPVMAPKPPKKDTQKTTTAKSRKTPNPSTNGRSVTKREAAPPPAEKQRASKPVRAPPAKHTSQDEERHPMAQLTAESDAPVEVPPNTPIVDALVPVGVADPPQADQDPEFQADDSEPERATSEAEHSLAADGVASDESPQHVEAEEAEPSAVHPEDEPDVNRSPITAAVAHPATSATTPVVTLPPKANAATNAPAAVKEKAPANAKKPPQKSTAAKKKSKKDAKASNATSHRCKEAAEDALLDAAIQANAEETARKVDEFSMNGHRKMKKAPTAVAATTVTLDVAVSRMLDTVQILEIYLTPGSENVLSLCTPDEIRTLSDQVEFARGAVPHITHPSTEVNMNKMSLGDKFKGSYRTVENVAFYPYTRNFLLATKRMWKVTEKRDASQAFDSPQVTAERLLLLEHARQRVTSGASQEPPRHQARDAIGVARRLEYRSDALLSHIVGLLSRATTLCGSPVDDGDVIAESLNSATGALFEVASCDHDLESRPHELSTEIFRLRTCLGVLMTILMSRMRTTKAPTLEKAALEQLANVVWCSNSAIVELALLGAAVCSSVISLLEDKEGDALMAIHFPQVAVHRVKFADGMRTSVMKHPKALRVAATSVVNDYTKHVGYPLPFLAKLHERSEEAVEKATLARHSVPVEAFPATPAISDGYMSMLKDFVFMPLAPTEANLLTSILPKAVALRLPWGPAALVQAHVQPRIMTPGHPSRVGFDTTVLRMPEEEMLRVRDKEEMEEQAEGLPPALSPSSSASSAPSGNSFYSEWLVGEEEPYIEDGSYLLQEEREFDFDFGLN